MIMKTEGMMKSAMGIIISDGARWALRSAAATRTRRISSALIRSVSVMEAPISVPWTTALTRLRNSSMQSRSAMAAGLDFSAAVRYYVERSTPSPLTQEFGITLKMLELGSNRNDALKEMAARLGIDEFRSLVNAVIQGTEMGASITDTLRINAEEIRRVRVAAAERKAQRAPSLMMIPMALFIMPAVFIIIFVPIYLRVQSSGMAGMF